MADTDQFTTQQILALTAVGESDKLGAEAMAETIMTALNRAAVNQPWLGGNDVRTVCLDKNQYDCWWPQTNNKDRERLFDIVYENPNYGPYGVAMGIAVSALAGSLADCTNGAVSYYDSDKCPEPYWAKGQTPCFVNGKRFYYDYKAITAPRVS